MHRALILAAVLLLAQGQVPAPVGGDMSNTTVKATGGTTARTLATRFPEVTAQDFSLTAGGGTADDTAAVQAAFNSGQPVFLIPGVYSVTCLTVPQGLTLRGANPATTQIKQRAGSTCSTLTGTGVGYVSISNLTINANHTGLHGVMVDHAGATVGFNWRIANTIIQGTTDACIWMSANTDTVISGNTLTDCGIGGVTLTTSASRFAVTDNNITLVNGPGVIFSVGIDGSIKGNTIQNSGPNGDCITGYAPANLRVAISGNSCLNSNNHGIHVGGTQLSITGNNIYSPTLNGIFVRATDNGGSTGNIVASNQVTIVGNNIYNPVTSNQSGIYTEDVNDGTITGNSIVNAKQFGINLTLNSGTVVSGNILTTGLGPGIYLRGSTNTMVSGNLVRGFAGDAYRSDQDTSNDTGAGTVQSTQNTFVGNASIGNFRDYIEAGASANNYYAFNNSSGATNGASPQITFGAGSIWNGTAASSSDLQLATAGGKQVLIKDAAATANYIQLGGSASGIPPSIKAAGDANRNLSVTGAGTGFVNTGVGVTTLAAITGGTVTMNALPTTCTAQPSKSVAAISGVLNLCP
jgi:parallel beta-helix repeat protein